MKRRFNVWSFAAVKTLVLVGCLSAFCTTGLSAERSISASQPELIEAPPLIAIPQVGIAPTYHYAKYGITYRYGHGIRQSPTQQIVLEVKDPLRCGCMAQVLVCVPACCQGVPKVHTRYGLLGRGYVTYCWDCGYTVNLSFLKLRHKIIVATR